MQASHQTKIKRSSSCLIFVSIYSGVDKTFHIEHDHDDIEHKQYAGLIIRTASKIILRNMMSLGNNAIQSRDITAITSYTDNYNCLSLKET